MACKTKILSYRVVVEPERLGVGSMFGWSFSVSDRLIESDEEKRLKEYENICERIVQDIRRHVDEVGVAYVDTETEEVCEYCGCDWNPDDEGNGCCEKEIEEAKSDVQNH